MPQRQRFDIPLLAERTEHRRHLRVGELARRTGVTVKALRLYDSLGLLLYAARSEANYRIFDEETVSCVQCIRALQAAGFTLRDLQELAGAYRRGEDVAVVLPERLQQISDRLDEQIDQLEAKRMQLRRLQQNCAGPHCLLAS